MGWNRQQTAQQHLKKTKNKFNKRKGSGGKPAPKPKGRRFRDEGYDLPNIG